MNSDHVAMADKKFNFIDMNGAIVESREMQD